ncbi:MAG: DNA-processing protein DprA [Firmicutes bacterium]|nr:DNA-processing protein DprA [Bacillota bacterium]
MSALKYWVWLSNILELSPRVKKNLLTRFGDVMELYFTMREALDEVEGLTSLQKDALMKKDLDPVLRVLDACEAQSVQILTYQDAEYPQRLKQIFDPPLVLYVKGRLPVIDEECAVAVVGTRRATPYGLKMARRIGFELTKCGGLVVSGLAEGIDSAAAEGALRAGGRCVGVLGTAIDEVFPRFNEPLFRDVTAVGAILSEYPPGAKTTRSSFPARNRIMSGLALGSVIVEAPEKSGALITAEHALEQGRDVFAVPGNADSPACTGSNGLIKEGAKAVTAGWDVLSEYAKLFPLRLRAVTGREAAIPQEGKPLTRVQPKPVKAEAAPAEPETGEDFIKLRAPSTKKEVDKPEERAYIGLNDQLQGLSEAQLKLVSVLRRPGMHVDDIIDASALPAQTVLSELTMLQIKGFVIQEAGKRFSLNIKKP